MQKLKIPKLLSELTPSNIAYLAGDTIAGLFALIGYMNNPQLHNAIGINALELFILYCASDSSRSIVFKDYDGGRGLTEITLEPVINYLIEIGGSIRSYFKGESSLE